MSESVVLCEGYHDRAFWAGWLLSLGCTDRGRRRNGAGRKDVRDDRSGKVVGGEYGFRSKSEKFVRIVPCGGDSKAVAREARDRLKEERQRWLQQAAESQLARLIFCIDPDVNVDQASVKTGFAQRDLRAWVNEFDPSAEETEHGDMALFDGRTVVSLVRWEVSDEDKRGLPSQQTLERLVCAALVAVYSDRGDAVQEWLDSRPSGPKAGPKEYAWSHMAGWYAQQGCQEFFHVLWEKEPEVVQELRSRLTESGAWRIAEALAE